MHLKKENRLRRSRKLRAKARELGVVRLCVNRTPRHISAQLISQTNEVLASASTLEAAIKSKLEFTGNVKAAEVIGEFIAERGLNVNVETVVFDRSGFSYHGRVRALADAARNKGLKF
jgi:large subunit ribosomal protein L18